MVIVSEKGQVMIPKKYRDKFGIKPGSEVNFEEEEGKLVLKRERTNFDDWEGFLGEGTTDKFMDKVRGRK